MLATRYSLREDCRRQDGNTILTVLMIVLLLIAMSTAHFTVVQKNIQQSSFFSRHAALRNYAESGVRLALHDLRYDVTGEGGNIGALNWTSADDLGRDGLASTADYGEADGIPTPGEPNTAPVAVGEDLLGGDLLVSVRNTGWPSIKQIVSAASTTRGTEAEAALEVYVEEGDSTLPRAGAVYVEPDAELTLNGNVFTVSGNDTNADGTKGSETAIAGISTEPGDPLGSNETSLSSQISPKQSDQVLGSGSGLEASVEEFGTKVDVVELYTTLKSQTDIEHSPGSFSDGMLGDSDHPQITHVDGDLDLSGDWTGAGVLLVNGNLSMSGQAKFEGIVIALGNVELTGGGQGIHIYGGLFTTGDLTLSGNADIAYSSAAYEKIEALIGTPYTVLYWHSLK